MKTTSFINKLNSQIENIILTIDEMLNNSSVYYNDWNKGSDVVILGLSPYHWRQKDEKTQMVAKLKYSNFVESFELLLRHANPKTKQDILNAKRNIINLINQKSAPKTIEAGKQNCRAYFSVFTKFIELHANENIKTVIVPDTNSLIQYPEPISYKSISQSENYEFIILPTVLSELDKHKITHRNEEFRKKVTSVIKRLKGYRNQGDVLTGVTVNRNITLKMIATEPNFEKSLSWLDPQNNDDRIIANVLELQVSNPSDNIIFVTSDINLQNKAELANLNPFDTDELK
ncbi:hypothetical protein CDL62_15790 [Alkalitalea saponilacus]|nr:PIN domain-containing protein [Alkalitalea saponilacus]ASB50422.1 hypothetical protein CDL62_15335 [Alkalitalea saponilacus]ASB50507.1 hypothetical protein CDL62_15790 [Alkalitalea saponilacus]